MDEETLRKKLPIGSNEKILKVVRHHWFAYVSVYIGTALIMLLIFIVLGIINVNKSDLQLSNSASSAITASGVVVALIIGLASLVPAWIKKQEHLVLTEEALMQVNKPSLFTNKVSQLNLTHISDVTVNQDMIGNILGYGRIVIETPGEQDNYIFTMLPDPSVVAKMIVEAHENYAAALESGQIQTTLGQRPAVPGTAWRPEPPVPPAASDPMPSSAPADSAASQPAQQSQPLEVNTNVKNEVASSIGHIASEESEEQS